MYKRQALGRDHAAIIPDFFELVNHSCCAIQSPRIGCLPAGRIIIVETGNTFLVAIKLTDSHDPLAIIHSERFADLGISLAGVQCVGICDIGLGGDLRFWLPFGNHRQELIGHSGFSLIIGSLGLTA